MVRNRRVKRRRGLINRNLVAMTEDEYIKKINPDNKIVPDRDRPNLGPGDMYGLKPRGSKLLLVKEYPKIGRVSFFLHKTDIYATAFNPDLGEEDVIGYSVLTDRENDLHIVDTVKGLGIGDEINYQFRKRNPFAPTGGLTKAGEATMRKAYRRLVKENIIEASSHTLTAAVSFRSTKELAKRYSAMFNKMTLGFEAEVSGGDNFQNDSVLDEETIIQNMEFEYTKQQFLTSFSQNKTAEEILETFDIQSPYGFAGTEETQAIRETYNKIRGVGFRVMGLPMQNGEPIMEEPSINGYQSPTGEMQQFALRDDGRIYNVKFAITKAQENLEIIKDLLRRYPIEKTENYVSQYIAMAPIDIISAVRWLENPEIARDETQIKRWIYQCGLAIHRYTISLAKFFEYCRKRGQEDYFIVVKTENGGLKLIQADKYNDSGGIISKPLVWSDDSHDYFKENFDESETEARQEAEREAITDAYGELNESESSVIDKIHDLVVENVDDDAVLSQGYHNSDDKKGEYTVVEGDSSITPAGAEIVSPIMTGPTSAFKWLDSVFDMFDKHDLVTNKTTGLHVNIGTFKHMNNQMIEEDFEGPGRPVIDVVKLAILSGDHYLLDQFGRFGNTYAQSLGANLRELAKTEFDPASMKTELWDVIKKLNKKFIDTQYVRTMSINMQHLKDKGYLEFRIAGGKNYHEDRDKVKKAIYRYMQLCAVACDPKAYFKEYMTELYKLFVGSKLPEDTNTEQPRPKNAAEALYFLRGWNNRYHLGKEVVLLGEIKRAVEQFDSLSKESVDRRIELIVELISTLDTNKYSSVNSTVLYSVRLIMLKALENLNISNPKAYLRNLWKEQKQEISSYRVYRTNPQWFVYLYTGQRQEELIAMQEITAASDKQAAKDIVAFKADLKSKRPELFNKPYSMAVLEDNYYTAISGGATDKEARVFCTKILEGYSKVPPGRLDTSADIAPDLRKQLAKYQRTAENRNKEWIKRKDEDLTTDLEAADGQSYTNKSKSVKIIYYANRSTPQVVKPGKTVKSKKGYGKRTKIRSATADEVAQFKKGKWLRTREDGKAPNAKGSKQSRYRPKLAAKSRAAKRRKLAAADTGLDRYLDFIHGIKKNG